MSITMSSRTFNAGDLIWSENAVAYALHVDASKNYCAECLTPASPQPLSRCSKCRHVFYCNRVCQKTHWPVHKRECACIVSTPPLPKLFLFFLKIRISYVDALMSTKSRQAELTSGYFFVCDCKRCRDFGQDFDSRIPPCCGKRLRGPVSDLSDNRMVAWPTDEALLASSLAKYTTVAPEEVLICDECHKAYNSAIFDAFEQRTSEIHVLKGMSNTFHVSSILPSLMKPSRWVPVVFYSLPPVSLFLSGEELDLVLEAGLRLMEWLQTTDWMRRRLFYCSLSCAFLGYLASVIFVLQDKLPRGEDGSGAVTLERLERFSEAFVHTTLAAAPCIKLFAPHLASVAEQLARLTAFAENLNVHI
ncbi:unnamed protein product [Mesocestoides corti]|uniref:MYND-type domain-containing protein n=1 Tax=Mesocestoides corti TaxID=53468 RepID=A0A0R3U459_MESCO|nr:unnamed protein product [Mesocestoides corti]